MPCDGNSEISCCCIDGVECKYLEENTLPDRRWVCGLRRRLGDWDSVLESPEYKRDIAPALEPLGINCKDWPDKATHGKIVRCMNCGLGV